MLYDKIIEYAESNVYPFHMPGHKRNPDFMPSPPEHTKPNSLPLNLDLTEVHGFDDLHNLHGILLETSKLAAAVYGSREAFLLINGSTVGILAAIGSHTKRGDKIIADANCHRSVPNAAGLFGLELVYIAPGIDEASGVPYSITPQSVESALRNNPDTGLVIITSPNYEGVVSDIASISELTQEAGALLLVDCAHGAHLGFSDYFPKNPITLGADITVTGLHKTLPALTQCSLLHICTNRADAAAVKQMLGILQTSSPSYLLMASIDYCLHLLDTNAGKLFMEYESNLNYFRTLVSRLISDLGFHCPTGRDNNGLFILGKQAGFFDLDPGKIVVAAKNSPISGIELSGILRTKYNLELERACPDYAIAMTSLCDTREGFTRLAEALLEINDNLCPGLILR